MKSLLKLFISVQELFAAEERMENSAGEKFYLGLMCCGSVRSLDIGVSDGQGNEVLDSQFTVR